MIDLHFLLIARHFCTMMKMGRILCALIQRPGFAYIKNNMEKKTGNRHLYLIAFKLAASPVWTLR